MKLPKCYLSSMSVAAGLALPSLCFGHGANIELAVVNNQLVTTHFFTAPNSSYTQNGVVYTGENYNPLYVGQSVRFAEVPMVQDTVGGTTGFTATTANSSSSSNNGWYGQPDLNYLESQGETLAQVVGGGTAFTGPGIAYGANTDTNGNAVSNGITASTATPLILTESLVGSLLQWNGSAFVASTTDRLQGIRGSLGGLSDNTLFTDPTGNEAGSWSTTQTALTPDSHNQVEWRLDSIGTETPDLTAADGLYLASVQISTNEVVNGQPVAASLPFYFLFEKNSGSIDSVTFSNNIAAATAFINSTLVPEPGSLALFGSGAIFILSRRRRRSS